jgi:hypothetical protein
MVSRSPADGRPTSDGTTSAVMEGKVGMATTSEGRPADPAQLSTPGHDLKAKLADGDLASSTVGKGRRGPHARGLPSWTVLASHTDQAYLRHVAWPPFVADH